MTAENNVNHYNDYGFDFPKDWPYVKSENVTIGNKDSSVVIATLWTKRGDIASQLPKESYAAVGQLYEKFGINLAIRNIAANPNIRYLVVCGADLSGSGEALVSLWKNGINEQRAIPGIEKSKIDENIPTEVLDTLRTEVQLIDLRDIAHNELALSLQELLPTLPLTTPREKIEVFPLPEVEAAEQLPSLLGAELVHGVTIGETWIHILKTVTRYGERVPTKFGNSAKDVTNLVAVVTGGDPLNPEFPEYFPFTKDESWHFTQALLKAAVPAGIAYTYGQRLRAYGEHTIDQNAVITMKLKRDPNDRGAIAVFHDPWRDNQLSPETIDVFWKDMSTPCISAIQARIVEGKLVVTAFLRSNEMYKSWPRDAIALRYWQGLLAKELDVETGPLTTISNSAHIYQEEWEPTQTVLETYGKEGNKFEEDPRGNVRIRIENRNIVVSHIDSTGVPLASDIVWSGTRNKAAIGLYNLLSRQGLFGTPSHAAYFGYEAALAELAIKTGLPYTQDSDAIIQEIVRKLQRLKELEQTLNKDSSV